jgi:hypothetical protein
MLEAVVAVLLLFSFFAAYKIGKIMMRYENAKLEQENIQHVRNLARERMLRIRAEKKGSHENRTN